MMNNAIRGSRETVEIKAGHIAGISSGVKAAGKEPFVQSNERTGSHQLIADLFVLVRRAIDPVDRCGPGQLGHLIDPPQPMVVLLRGIEGLRTDI